MKEHHIGIIVNDISEELKIYEKLGYRQKSELCIDNYQNNKVLFLEREGSSTLIELVEPIANESTVRSSIKGYHHVCYEIDSDKELDDMFAVKGIGVLFCKKVIAPALNHRKVSFALLRNGTIIEFLHK